MSGPLAEVVREVLADYHDDHNWAQWVRYKLDLALHQEDGCQIFRADCPVCDAEVEAAKTSTPAAAPAGEDAR